MYLHKIYRQVKLMVFKTDTMSLDTTQHGTAIFSIPWCIGQQAFTELYTYFNTYEESGTAGNKEK